jgi:hypothetical protein
MVMDPQVLERFQQELGWAASASSFGGGVFIEIGQKCTLY